MNIGVGIIIGLAIYGAIDMATELCRFNNPPKKKKRPPMPSEQTIMSAMKDVDQIAWVVIITPERVTHRVNPN